MKVDISSDMGESFGRWKLGADEELMQYLSSANIACGFHAGDPMVMRYTVKLAIKHGVQIGPHVGFPDLMGFGRRVMGVTPEEYINYSLYQGGALRAIAEAEGAKLQHFTFHAHAGYMYYNNEEIARAAATAVAQLDKKLLIPVLDGPQGLLLTREAEKLGVKVVKKFFADREIQQDGKLVSRSISGSVITDPERCADRTLKMVLEKKVTTFDGKEIAADGKTIIIHGDTPNGVNVARAVRERLEANGVKIVPMRQLV
jgi:UPF0271 protein